MNVKSFTLLSASSLTVILLTLSFLPHSSSNILIEDEAIRLDSTRVKTTPIESLFDHETPTMANATSQLQLLTNERLTIEDQLQTLQAQYDQLKEQHDILMNELNPYLTSLSQQILDPLTKLKQQVEKQSKKHADDSVFESSLYALSFATDAIEQYMTNPNEATYETSLQTAFKLIDQELKEQDTSSVFTLASNVLQSGIDKAILQIRLKTSKRLLETFETNYVTVSNDETKQFKKTKQQQLATEDALNLTALQLDEVALRLSGILDEIEQVTQ